MSLSSLRSLRTFALAVAWVVVATEFAPAQITDRNGYITSGNWLILGHFAQPYTCGGTGAEMLENYIAPSDIHCQFPQEGDEIEYDPALSASTGYLGPKGPGGRPMWRIFNDGSNNCDIDLAGDREIPNQENVMAFLATYVDYDGLAPIEAEICLTSDDGAQVWLDEQLVFNRAACRGRANCAGGSCDDVFPVTFTPGPHRIILGVWNGCCGYGASLRIQVDGIPVVDGNPEWYFGGIYPSFTPPPCRALPRRDVSGVGEPQACPPRPGGPVKVTITQEGGLPDETVKVTEVVRGAVSASLVSASHGGAVKALAQDPLAPVGIFQDHRNIVVDPVCDGGNGDTLFAAGTYTLTNAGADIWQNGDTFQFAYSKIRGDFDVTARIASRVPAAGTRWGKHGIMARQDLTPRSRYSMTHDAIGDVTAGADNNDESNRHACRPTHGGSDNFEQTTLPSNPGGDGVDDYCDGIGPDNGTCTVVHHDYIRLERTGSIFRSYSRAAPGDPWTFLGSSDWGRTAPEDVLLGVVACSHSTSCTSRITIEFDEVDFSGATVVPLDSPPPIGVEITWSVPRSVLQGPGVSYTIDYSEGLLEFRGNVSGSHISGTSSVLVLPAAKDFGPFVDPNFEHAHAIGRECSGMSVMRPAPGTLVIDGAGTDIWQGGDQFVFAYNSVKGEFSARVRIAEREFAPGSRWGKHGIMARQDCTPTSRYSMIHDNGEDPQDNVRFGVRPTHGGSDNFEIIPPGTALHANELRLDRLGNTIIGYVLDEIGAFGAEPGAWAEIGRFDWGATAPETLLVGLCVTSHQGCDVTSIRFTNWELRLGPPEVGVQNLTCRRESNGDVTLAWQNPPGARPEVPISIRVQGLEVASVPGTASTARIPAGDLPESGILAFQVVNSSGLPVSCVIPEGLTPEGFINRWLLLSPLSQSGGANPPAATIRRDYLTDGAAITETTVRPRAGDTVRPDYGGAAASTGLAPTPTKPELNPGGVPTWTLHIDADDTINFDDYQGYVEDFMAYGVVYLDVPEDIVADIGLASDDSIQVLLDGTEIFLNSVARGYGDPNTIQDVISSATVPALNPLKAGRHLLMVKVFDGLYGNGFRLRFQDPTGVPIAVGRILWDPEGRPRFHRGDPNDDGAVNITDGIFVLNYLFLGGPAPSCLEAANANDDGSVNITDGIFILNYLFLGGPAPPDPGPADSPCGPDPETSPSDLGCEAYDSC